MMTDKTNSASAKIVDFGLVKMLGPGVMTMEPFGTIGYCAPEILLGKPYS
jgi:serine/threonine protein kinase